MTAQLAVDIGGTFTDVVLELGERRYSTKVLTTHQAPEQAVLHGVRQVLNDAGIEAGAVGRFVHGTTLATNALIERRGAATALITTAGFRDSLEIAYEHRFAQYDLFMRRPAPLIPRQLRLELAERCAADGTILQTPDESDILALLPTLRAAGVQSVAIVFLHSFTEPGNEQRVREVLAREAPELSICLSHEVCPEIREYERLCTTVANAYVRPVMSRYLERLERSLQQELGLRVPVMLMTSGGGLTDLATARRFPVRLVESGPAGGVIMANHVAAAHGIVNIVAFDMGGTTAKLCLVEDGKPEESRLFEVAREYRFQKGSGIPIRIPVIELVEIGAGGGSIARVDSLGRIQVGPESAGSEPGPACYGQGEHATVTDADLQLGRVDPAYFGGGQLRLSPEAATRAIDRHIGKPLGLDTPMAALGISEMVDEAMASATRVHAIERGLELDERTLVATGGAAPLHAARLAQKLGIQRVIIPRDAGVGSAVGFLRAPIAYSLARSRLVRVDEWDDATIGGFLRQLADEAIQRISPMAQGRPITLTWRVDTRYVGQGHELQLELIEPINGNDAGQRLRERFEAAYRQHYQRIIPGHGIECLNWMVEARVAEAGTAPGLAITTTASTADTSGSAASEPSSHPGRAQVPATEATPRRSADAATAPAPLTAPPAAPTHARASAAGERQLWDPATGAPSTAQVFLRGELAPGQSAAGPALVVERQTTTVVPQGFRFVCASNGDLVLERAVP